MKKPLSLLLFLCFGTAIFAGWRSDLVRHLEKNHNPVEVYGYLNGQYQSVPEFDRPLCSLLLSYFSHKMGVLDRQNYWTGKFFENHRAIHTSLEFLPKSIALDLSYYEEKLKTTYPLIIRFGLRDGGLSEDDKPGRELVLQLKMNNRAFYKITHPLTRDILKGGVLQKGRNYIRFKPMIPLDKDGAHFFFLSLKAGEMVLEKRVELDVRLTPLDDLQTHTPDTGQEPALYSGEVHHVDVTGNVEDLLFRQYPGPESIIDGTYPSMGGGIPILPAFMSLLRKIFSKKKKIKEKPKPPPPIDFRIHFFERDHRGQDRLVEVEIKLRITDR